MTTQQNNTVTDSFTFHSTVERSRSTIQAVLPTEESKALSVAGAKLASQSTECAVVKRYVTTNQGLRVTQAHQREALERALGYSADATQRNRGLTEAQAKVLKQAQNTARQQAKRARDKQAMIDLATNMLTERNGLGEHETTDKATAIRRAFISLNPDKPYVAPKEHSSVGIHGVYTGRILTGDESQAVSAATRIVETLTTRFRPMSAPIGKRKQADMRTLLKSMEDLRACRELASSVPRVSTSTYTAESVQRHYVAVQCAMPTCKASQKTRDEKLGQAGANGIVSVAKSRYTTYDKDGNRKIINVPDTSTKLVFAGGIRKIAVPLVCTAHVETEMMKLRNQLANVRYGLAVPQVPVKTAKVMEPVTLLAQSAMFREDGIASVFPRPSVTR